ncbi:MAG: nucleolar RNA-binding Nop10p family protein [archaeon]
MKHILKCQTCGKYSLKQECLCGTKAVTPEPPKYSPDDKYAEYRRRVKQPEWEKKGLL